MLSNSHPHSLSSISRGGTAVAFASRAPCHAATASSLPARALPQPEPKLPAVDAQSTCTVMRGVCDCRTVAAWMLTLFCHDGTHPFVSSARVQGLSSESLWPHLDHDGAGGRVDIEPIRAVSGVPHLLWVVIADDEPIVVSAPHRQRPLRLERLGDCPHAGLRSKRAGKRALVVAITDGEAVGLRRAVREVEEALAGGHGGGDTVAVVLAKSAPCLAMPHLPCTSQRGS